MAFEKIRALQYIADTKEDLKLIPDTRMGTECYVIKEACEYKLMSTGEWIKQVASGSSIDIDLSDYATEQYVDKAIQEAGTNYATKAETTEALAEKADKTSLADAEKALEDFKKEVKELYRPLKYKISNVPAGTIVDYDREKEIRIYCPDNVVFTKQEVGEGGNAFMYYMTFTSYAPEGAVGLKEGDRGTIIDEYIPLKGGTGTGIDAYGRKYKNHWFALASYDEATGKWTYFGKNSTTNKYIGWTYEVEWYDENKKLIDADILRINLSNSTCHLTLDDMPDESIDEMTIWAELNEN